MPRNEQVSRFAALSADLTAPLNEWLAQRKSGAVVKVLGIERPRSGYSAETWLVDTEVDGGRQRFVLKRETPDPPIYPTQVPTRVVEVDIQYRVMQSLSRCPAIPIAVLVGYESDRRVLGQPFFVMEFVHGVILPENPPYPLEGYFADASSAVRNAVVSNGLGLLAAIHEVNWRQVGLGWLYPTVMEPSHLRQLNLWERFGSDVLGGRHHPEIAAGLRWLHTHDARGGPPVFNWGDARPGNIIYDNTECVCAMDFEAAAIAPPEADLGWWLFFDRTMHEGAGLARSQGDPTREQQCDIYSRASGRSLGDIHWFEVFAGVKYAMIVVRVMNRAVERGELARGADEWLRNRIVDCLTEVLVE